MIHAKNTDVAHRDDAAKAMTKSKKRKQLVDKKFKALSDKEKDQLLRMLAVEHGLVQDDDE